MAALVTLIFFMILVWQFVNLAAKYGSAGRTTRTIGLALAPWWWGTTAIMALCIPVQTYVTFSWLRSLISGAPASVTALKQDQLDPDLKQA